MRNSCATLFALLLLLPHSCFAGEWTKNSDDTLRFQGEVVAGDLDKLRAIFDDKVTSILVDSSGGLTTEGIRMGQFLVDKNLTVFVDGICMSSCANYIFAVAKKKVIRNGVVGFHGNMTAFVKMVDGHINDLRETAAKLGEDWSKEILRYLRVQLEVGPEFSEAETWARYDAFKAAALDEQKLFAGLGISQDFLTALSGKTKECLMAAFTKCLFPRPRRF